MRSHVSTLRPFARCLAASAAGLIFALSSASANSLPLIEQGAGLTKTGVGTLSLNGSNTYTGATVISAGTLVLGEGHILLLNPTFDGVNVPSLTLGTGSLGSSLTLDFGSGSLFDGAGYVLFDFADSDFGGSFTELAWWGGSWEWSGSWESITPADGTLLIFTAIPEPASAAALLGLAAVGIAGSRRRRRQARA